MPETQTKDRPKANWLAQLRLLRYAKSHWGRLLIMLSMMGLSIGLQVLRPWPTKLLFDQVLDHKPLAPGAQHLLNWLPAANSPHGLLLWVCIATVLIFLF